MVIHEDPNPARLFDCTRHEVIAAYEDATEAIEAQRAQWRTERWKRVRTGFMEVVAVIGGTIAWGCMIAAAL